MFHAHTDRVLDEWRRHRSGRDMPARTELSPALFGALLPQMFVLADDVDAWRVRLAGGFLTDLYGRELKGDAFAKLWAAPDRAAVRRALDAARRTAEPRVLCGRAVTSAGASVMLEVLLAPVTGPTGEPDRVLGLVQPVTSVGRLAGGVIDALHLADRAEAATCPRLPLPALRLVVDNTRAAPLG